ncbi:hypothetical protein ACSU1N_05085 [Thermogladius sp. 4427co]|uniref:hypothetical protein n=1 Tax=Thermogladius sp. 4427co TaxID=3450718 RepID=UPI003F7A261A
MVGVKAWSTALAPIALVAVILLGMLLTPFALAQTQQVTNTTTTNENIEVEHEEEIDIANGTIAVRPAFNITFDQALKLAYDVRNVTYPLFEWEISHNVSVANITLNLGDRFLEKALNLSSNNTRLATVSSIVAAIHYSHAVPLAYSVLGKTLDTLFDQNATTGQITSTVLDLASQLGSVLSNAVSIAQSRNLSIPEGFNNLTSLAEQLLSYARSNLSSGNITLAYRLGIKAYHLYVKAYGLLVTSVFVNDLSLPRHLPVGEFLFREKLGPETLIKVFDKLPGELKQVVVEKIRMKELNDTDKVVEYIREIALQWKVKEKAAFGEYIQKIVDQMIQQKANENRNIREIIRFRFKSEDELRNNLTQLILSSLSQNKTLSQVLDEVSRFLSNVTNGQLNLKAEFENKIVKVHIEIEAHNEEED